jgi:hypothetical protein
MSYRHRNNSRNMHQQVQSAINEGRLKFIESPQMKLDKDTFPTNMNMVELEGKKVLVQSSQVKMTKGKEVIIGEERPLRMIKPNSLKDGQWQKNEGGGAATPPKGHLRHPYGQVQRRQDWRQGARKLDHPKSQTGQFNFPESGQQLCSRELVRQTISYSTMPKFRSLGSLSARVSSDTLLPSQATNA